MWQLLAKVVLGLTIALLIPTALVLASQSAVPGDKIYPVKRTLENGIATVASLNSVTRAYFKTDFSKRRFDEAIVLVNRGDNATLALNELVEQTKAAKDSIIAMSDRNLRKQFAGNLSSQIDNYNKVLASLDKKQVAPTPKPGQSITPSPSQPSQNSGNYDVTQEELKRIREELEKLKQQLKEQAASQNSNNLASAPTNTPVPAKGGPVAALDQRPTSAPTPTKEPEDKGKCSAIDILRQRTFGGTGSATTCIPTHTPVPTIQFTPTPTATSSPGIQGVSIKINDLPADLLRIITGFFR